MALSFNYNGETFTILRSWTKTRTAVPSFDGLDVIGFDETYTVQSIFLNSTAAERLTDLTTLKDKLGAHGFNFTITQDGTDLVSFDAVDIHGDGPFPELTIPGTEEALKAGKNVPFTFTIRGRVDPEGGTTILSQSEQTTISFDKKLLQTTTLRGQIKTAIGNSAFGQRATITPGLAVGFERERQDFVTDNDDLVMDYTFVDVQTNRNNPTNAREAMWTVQLTTHNGRETWVLAGNLVFENGQKPSESQVDKLITVSFPTGVSVTERSITINPRDNSMAFTITGMQSYGKSKTLEFRETYTLRAVNQRRVFKAVGKQGPDVRQDVVNPDLLVTQAGSAMGHTAFPAFPPFAFPAADIQDQEQAFGEIVFDSAGKIATASISWRYAGQIINEISDAEDANISTQFLSQADAEKNHPAKSQASSSKLK